MKQQNIVPLSYEKIADLLNLREDHQVIGIIQSDNDKCCNRMQVLIQGPALMEVPENHAVSWIRSDLIPQKENNGRRKIS